jgi:hypothetical protein
MLLQFVAIKIANLMSGLISAKCASYILPLIYRLILKFNETELYNYIIFTYIIILFLDRVCVMLQTNET